MWHKLVIAGTLPNLNDYIAQLNISKFRGAELKRTTEQRISQSIWRHMKNLQISNPVSAHFRWYEPSKKRDLDNIAFAKKFIFDALVKCRVLKNDGWACVEGFSDSFNVDVANPRVEVVLRVNDGLSF